MRPHGEYLGLIAQCEPAPDHFSFGLIDFLLFESRYLPSSLLLSLFTVLSLFPNSFSL